MKNWECVVECLEKNNKEMTLNEICDYIEKHHKEKTINGKTFSQTLKTEIYRYCSQSRSYKEDKEDIFYKIETTEGVKFGLNAWKQYKIEKEEQEEIKQQEKRYREGGKKTVTSEKTVRDSRLRKDYIEYLKNKQLIKTTGFGNASKGITATLPIKNFALGLIRDWLLKPVTITKEEGKEVVEYTVPNLSFIKNRALLKELMLYNPAINVDRIMSLCQLMLYREEKMILYQGEPRRAEKTIDASYLGNDPFFTRNYKQ